MKLSTILLLSKKLELNNILLLTDGPLLDDKFHKKSLYLREL
jgi:hypothetical protein